MKIVYIAGPFRGKTPWDVECNVRRAEILALAVARAGAMPLCPHTMTRHFDKQCTDEFWLEGTLALLRKCDAIIMTVDWMQSTGAQLEYNEARNIQMPVFFETHFSDLEEWIKKCT